MLRNCVLKLKSRFPAAYGEADNNSFGTAISSILRRAGHNPPILKLKFKIFTDEKMGEKSQVRHFFKVMSEFSAT